MKQILIYCIKFYQYLSRSIIQGGSIPLLVYSGCRFYPTCSDYTIGVISKYGIWKGLFKSVVRILKCNPLGKGGINNP
ncbi:MAG: membrane protein insertion efficiency factor YidD [Candidatus Yanofskybacteria bacterium RIFCSPHIGHO2_02_FULL_39_10]|uniref:Putative membrane protein insertion efficiency factor n=1 Tax=Candidatus Yanofskybacteria bacterium RIFCSPHIGHO2_02_FULL_39_10 TaxID=1802674 RepID=A0A1F8F4E5_9BACT|nr:MAG: membrane protein insertion efficiency factor YidD [Candidatus Yanofskybacteria bacterium RIFCSPHIGHO2_02_FULL_39_10]